ncbi:hypothetical protein RJT34_13698 [Clitoria ternatea]|uniref:Uncharacterized protein n=1 Tax=Clitoria ternatea TaxID=43366 RepID=A0AAN9JPF0_CLITE
MGKALTLFLLLLSSSTMFAQDFESFIPTSTPTHSPTQPPHHQTTDPYLHSFPRSFVDVQGAIVKLKCNNTIYPVVQDGQSGKNGYFYMEAPKSVTSFGAHKYKVFLFSAPNNDLNPSNLNGGVTGSLLKPEKPFVSQDHKLPFLLYRVGPFAFESKCSH